jgi:predicted dehydrogenase
MSLLSRRELLQRSMLSTAAALAAQTVPQAYAKPQESKSPNERIGVAVMGVNGRGGDHIRGLNSAAGRGSQILYVCDVDSNIGAERAGQIAEMQGGMRPKVEGDIRKVLEDKSVDVVTVATPNHWHSLAAIWAVQAGKHVYCEKPVSHHISEGRRAVEAARKYNKIVQTGTQSRSNPGMRDAMAFLHAGNLGEVKVARGLCYKRRPSIGPKGDYPVPAHINYDLWCGPAPMGKVTRKKFHYDWHWQWDFGNGDLGNQGIHQMDLCRWALGASTLCNSVCSYGGRFGYEDAGETANTQIVMHDYGDKSLVFEVRGLETPKFKDVHVGIIIECTSGYLVMTSYDSGTAFDPQGAPMKTFKGGGDGNHYDNFLAAIRAGDHTKLNADIEEGHLSSALCHLGNISYRLGSQTPFSDAVAAMKEVKTNDDIYNTFERTIEHLKANKVDVDATKLAVGATLTLNPKEETFTAATDGKLDQANAMLTREDRKPYVVPAKGQV